MKTYPYVQMKSLKRSLVFLIEFLSSIHYTILSTILLKGGQNL